MTTIDTDNEDNNGMNFFSAVTAVSAEWKPDDDEQNVGDEANQSCEPEYSFLLLFSATREGALDHRPSAVTLHDIKSSLHDSLESAKAAAQAIFDDGVKATGDYDAVEPDVLEWAEVGSGAVWEMPDLYLCKNWWECQIRKLECQ